MKSAHHHPLHRLHLAEDLLRLRRSSEHRRYAAPQRAGHIDVNPHQVQAVVFALSRIREGGCILADEVGLGKTIEAGLVVAQLLAEGKRRILLITPKALLGQWRQELYDLFGIEAVTGRADADVLAADGVFVLGRESATSETGKGAILANEPFDLCVVDEAHEIFSGIHKRFDKHGQYRDERDDARMAGRLREILRVSGTPVLLLTATPIQNNLAELWGLVQYVDPTETLLGNLSTFRQVFCPSDDRILADGQEEELRRRIQRVVQRTLRRQAQEFLRKPFVGREARLFEYAMSPQERSLYEDVTAYLLDPNIVAFRTNSRHLLLIGFHRRIASSTRALCKSLENVAKRLRRRLGESAPQLDDADDLAEIARDLEDEDLVAGEKLDVVDTARVDPQMVRAELDRVESFVQRARQLQRDGKSEALLEAVRVNLAREQRGESSGRVVIFTESVVTQDYLADLLADSELVQRDEITLFRGHNDGPRVHEALERWDREVQAKLPVHARPDREIAVRLALVHEFKTHSRIFISTEAGAKGLNLQFCDTIVNYDLPWNPQKIEQRIGRCHRYGQTRDVTVINFIASDNAAQKLTFEILMQKLELFGTVLDASDQVLHRAGNEQPETLAGALGLSFQSRLEKIYQQSRSIGEVEAELRALREDLDVERKRFEEIHRRTAGLIEATFDDDVKRSFRRHQEEVPKALAELDRDLQRLVVGYLDARGIAYERREQADDVTLVIPASPLLPGGLAQGLLVAVGASAQLESLHLAHPLVRAAVEEARRAAKEVEGVRVFVGHDAPAYLLGRRGERGRYVLIRAHYAGFEDTQRLVPIVVLADGPLRSSDAAALLASSIESAPHLAGQNAVTNDDVEDAIEELLFLDQPQTDGPEQERFERAMEQVERFAEDRLMILRRDREALDRQIEAALHKRDTALGAEARTSAEASLKGLQQALEDLEDKIERLQRREDEDYQQFRERMYRKRYARPTLERLIDVPLELA